MFNIFIHANILRHAKKEMIVFKKCDYNKFRGSQMP